MELQSLRELFLTELQELYFAEKQITAALPSMAKAASGSASYFRGWPSTWTICA